METQTTSLFADLGRTPRKTSAGALVFGTVLFFVCRLIADFLITLVAGSILIWIGGETAASVADNWILAALIGYFSAYFSAKIAGSAVEGFFTSGRASDLLKPCATAVFLASAAGVIVILSGAFSIGDIHISDLLIGMFTTLLGLNNALG